MPGANGSGRSWASNDTYTSVDPRVQWPAVSTTRREISVPEQRKRVPSCVKRTSPTLLCTVSGEPPTIAPAGAAGTSRAAATAVPHAAHRVLRDKRVPLRVVGRAQTSRDDPLTRVHATVGVQNAPGVEGSLKGGRRSDRRRSGYRVAISRPP